MGRVKDCFQVLNTFMMTVVFTVLIVVKKHLVWKVSVQVVIVGNMLFSSKRMILNPFCVLFVKLQGILNVDFVLR